MAYINFREEKYVVRSQMKKRKSNNKKLLKQLKKNDKFIQSNDINEKYSFKEIVNICIGNKGILDENEFILIENENIASAVFLKCKFRNVKFKNCKFIGCIFKNCEFGYGGVLFENCIFIKRESEVLPSLNRVDNLSCSFYECKIYAKFINCDISACLFEKCKIENTNFNLTYCKKSIINESMLKNIKICDCNFSGFKIVESYLMDFDFDDNYFTKFDENTFFDKLKLRKNNKQEYEGVYKCYETIADKYKENNLNNNFGEYYYLAKNTQRKCVKLIPKIGSYLYWITCGYGERPEFCILSSIVIILVFTIIYMIVGIDIQGEIIKYNISTLESTNISKIIKDFNEALNLSIGMFACVGINNSKPTEIAYIVSNFEMLIGIVMVGLGIGTLTRKVIR